MSSVTKYDNLNDLFDIRKDLLIFKMLFVINLYFTIKI